ncbi:hypothetical protein HBO40_00335 [Pseudomonas protegens]|uniref:head-tail joining protein n=1 Tax=Pseudomonas TaxID=286 RepID=UPI001473FF0A|nr:MULTISPECIES: hypothetical protein [Pseudomonas]MDT9644035.1 hypothetical protein [Pseudomonas sp. JV245A]NMZ26048.1 hypothetical protein [Pseudomonas protegens]NMZ84631.1 hypothetical protein [Pseudomonas protegens]
MSFRDRVAVMDTRLLDVLGDEAVIEGIDRPIPGFLAAPWLQPKLGRINTGLREPRFEIRVSDAAGITPGRHVSIDLPAQDGGGNYDLVRLEPGGTGWVALVLRAKA